MMKTSTTTLQTRLDQKSKETITQAARLRHVGLSDYVRLVLVSTAKREVEQAKTQVLQMTADEQERFWMALQAPANLTKNQRKLGNIMQGNS